LVVSINKLRSFGKVLSEGKVNEASAGPQTAFIRSAIATMTPVLGGVLLALYILMRSSSLLPPAKVILSMLVILGLFIAVAHRSISAFHEKWETELSQSLEAPTQVPAQATSTNSVIQESNMASVVLQSGNTAIGKRIRELQLRTLTGASIVGIERSNRVLVNPEPDEELSSGDRILLLGSAEQLQRAQSTLVPNS
jgi:CPA2 family monovalent cation:H+ antiporter-2